MKRSAWRREVAQARERAAKTGFAVVLPSHVTLRLARTGARARIFYEERFPSKKLVANTIRMFKPLARALGLKVSATHGGYGIALSGTAPYALCAGIVVSEFASWTPLFEMTLRELVARSSMLAITASSPVAVSHARSRRSGVSGTAPRT